MLGCLPCAFEGVLDLGQILPACSYPSCRLIGAQLAKFEFKLFEVPRCCPNARDAFCPNPSQFWAVLGDDFQFRGTN